VHPRRSVNVVNVPELPCAGSPIVCESGADRGRFVPEKALSESGRKDVPKEAKNARRIVTRLPTKFVPG
jgi:hypothetical protein